MTSFTDDPAPEILGDEYAKLPAELRDLVDPLRAQLWAALADLPTQLTHGDCNAGNVLVHNGEITGYIDLDHLPHGPRVRDLSYYLASRLLDQIVDGDPHAMVAVPRHYVAGYHSIQRCSRAARKLTEAIRTEMTSPATHSPRQSPRSPNPLPRVSGRGTSTKDSLRLHSAAEAST